MIEVSGLSKRYADHLAVRDISFKVARGEVVGFLGPNGAGKTTTMRMVTGFLPPTKGRIVVDGHDIAEDPLGARRAIGYLPETPPLYPEMRVVDYVGFVAALKDVPRSLRREKVDRALEICGLSGVRRKVIGTLSKGYRQRVGLAQAVVHDPPVLVLDEPTAGLDPVQIVEIRRLIHSLADQQGRTVVLSTHILPEVEAICKRVILISFGELRLDGTLEEVRGQSSLEDVFLREAGPRAAEGPTEPEPSATTGSSLEGAQEEQTA